MIDNVLSGIMASSSLLPTKSPIHSLYCPLQTRPAFVPGTPGIHWRLMHNALEKSCRSGLDFDLDVNARRKVQAHQHIDRLGIRVQHINQSIMGPDLKMLV